MNRFWIFGRRGVRLSWPLTMVLCFVLAACTVPAQEISTPLPATPSVSNEPPVAEEEPTPVAQPLAQAAAPEPAADAIPAESTNPANATGLLYNGEIAARSTVNVIAEVAGEVLEVNVEVGDRVRAGDILIKLDSTRLEAQQAQALAGLEAIQAQLELMTEPPNAADLAAAQAGVAAASAAYRRASNGPTEEELRAAEAQLRLAQAAVTMAQAAYNQVKGDMNINSRPETLQLKQAKLAVEAAQAQYDKLLKGATQDAIAAAYSQLAQARAGLKRLQDGVPDEQIEALEAQIEQTEASLYLAQLQLSKAQVKAPIDGIVSRVAAPAGTMAGPGTLLLVILSEEVEVTIPVEETRLPLLAAGQPAMIRVPAYPDRQYPGEIAYVAPKLDPATRTVRVTVRPSEITTDLRPGMFATVELVTEAAE
jgi:multidrug efflux pump subunit AcrA (membrane-fusion protein)